MAVSLFSVPYRANSDSNGRKLPGKQQSLIADSTQRLWRGCRKMCQDGQAWVTALSVPLSPENLGI